MYLNIYFINVLISIVLISFSACNSNLQPNIDAAEKNNVNTSILDEPADNGQMPSTLETNCHITICLVGVINHDSYGNNDLRINQQNQIKWTFQTMSKKMVEFRHSIAPSSDCSSSSFLRPYLGFSARCLTNTDCTDYDFSIKNTLESAVYQIATHPHRHFKNC